MNMIDLETPQNTIKYYGPPIRDPSPFYIPEYGRTMSGTPCYQLRMEAPIGCVQYVISGSGILICNDQMYSLKAGDTFLLPEGSNHIYYSNPDNHFERIWLNFKGELAKALLSVYNLEEVFVFPGADTSALLAEIQQICRESTDPIVYQNRTSRLFLELIQFLAPFRTQREEVTSPVESIRLFIDRHITENLKVSDIADHFSFSPEHIIRIFKSTYQITPHQYILQSKIRLSMIMLKMNTDTIEEISEKLNFSDPHHFSAQFKKYVGCTPTQYRHALPTHLPPSNT